MKSRRPQCGFIMLPVVIALTLLATVVYLMSRDAGMGASMAGRGLDADAARYVAEAGLARMNYKAQTSNCVGYGVLNNVAFGADSFSANASPAAGSPVTLTATATTASGATTTLTRANVTVRKTTPYVMTLQPGTSGTDTYIESNGPARNFGGENQLKLEGGRHQALIRFDLSSVPAGSLVQSAQLMLYKTAGGVGSGTPTITAYPLTRAWVEGTLSGGTPADGATWNTTNGTTAWTAPGGDYDTASGVAIASTGSNNIWLSWDVTNIVAGWVGGSAANNGLVVIPSASIPGQSYVSSDATTSVENRPKLAITFLPPCDWTSPPVTVTLAPSADANLNGTSPGTNYGSSTSIWVYESGQRRGVLQFDTSSVAAGSPITSATLRLYVTSLGARSGGAMNLEVHALTNSWTENRVSWTVRTSSQNWATAGGDYQASTAATLTVPASFNSGWIEFNVTALAQAWVDGVTANNGVIVLELSPDQFFIASKEDAPSTAPQLVIVY